MNTPNTKQKIILVYAGFTVIVFLAWLLFFSGGGGLPKIVSSSTESQDGTYIARAVTTMVLDQELPTSSELTAKIFPDTPHDLAVNGKTVTLTPQEDLADGVPYTFWLMYAESELDDPVVLTFVDQPNDIADADIGAYKYTTPENTVRRDFLDDLPKDFGNYSIIRPSERTLYVTIEKGDFAAGKEEALTMLAGVGITEAKFDIGFNNIPQESDLERLLDQQVWGHYD